MRKIPNIKENYNNKVNKFNKIKAQCKFIKIPT